MTSDPVGPSTDRIYVWVWLPGRTEPVVAGALTPDGRLFGGEPVLIFAYARSYRERPEAISLWPHELPLRPGGIDPTVPDQLQRNGADVGAVLHRRTPLALAGCLRDAAPDAWGRRVLNLRLHGDPNADLNEATYLLSAGSDRIGALDFQGSPTDYVSRDETASLRDLLMLAELVDTGRAVPEDLALAAAHGTSIGGARPKALLRDGHRRLVAKFPSSSDARPVVQAEAVAMIMAARAGLDVAPVEVVPVDGREVLLVDRFDRVGSSTDPAAEPTRRLMLSALTLLGRNEFESRHTTYPELADAIRVGPFVEVTRTLRELYTRLVLNVCVGNNDDHLRNHAVFWDGQRLRLTPAYDVAPQPRSTRVSSQAIGITRDGRRQSQLWLCREAAVDFTLRPAEADAIIDHVVTTIETSWHEVCDEARLTRSQREALRGREFLNPYVFYEDR